MKLTKASRILLLLLIVVLTACKHKDEKEIQTTDTNNYISEYDYFRVAENASDYAVVIDGEIVGNEAVKNDGKLYINIEIISKRINSRFYWGKSDDEVLFACPDKMVKLEDDEVFERDGKMYILAEYVSRYSDIGIKVIDEGAKRVIIDTKSGERVNNKVLVRTEIRIREELKGSVVRVLNPDDEVTVIGHEKGDGIDWTKVITADGYVGFVKSSDLAQSYMVTVTRDYEKLEYTRMTIEGKVCLMWHQVLSDDDNEKFTALMKKVKGVNIVAPTWITIADVSGNISSKSLNTYVEEAHDINLKVWVVVSDASVDENGEEVNYLESILPKSSRRVRLINSIIEDVKKCGADGVNVDFASVTKELEADYIQFLQELSVACRSNGIVLAVNGNNCNMKAQGELADYYIIKSYNEHTKGSDKAGSVASINFVKAEIDKVLKSVPADKVVNGVPLFTRLWMEVDSALSSKVIGMQSATSLLLENEVTPVWQEEYGQHYGEFSKDGITYKVWLEDAESMQLRLEYMEACNIAGVGCWKLGMEDASIWDVFDNYMK